MLDKEKLQEIFKNKGEDRSRILEQVINESRNKFDSSYEFESCRKVCKLLEHMTSDTSLTFSLTSSDKEKVLDVASVYKLEMTFGAPSGVPELDKDNKFVFNRKSLEDSREILAKMLDELKPNEGYGDIIRRKGILGEMLLVSDSFNAMTNPNNPAKFGTEKQNRVLIGGEICDAQLQKDSEGKFVLSFETGDGVKNVAIDKYSMSKTPKDATFAFQRNDEKIVAALKRAVEPQIGPEIV